MEAKLYIEKIVENAQVPVKKNSTDSGFDVFALGVKQVWQNFGGNGERLVEGKLLESAIKDNSIELTYLERALITTGLKVTCGKGYEIQVRPRSGLALKQGLTVLNTPGTIDEAYRDELGIIVVNLSRKAQVIEFGTRIAQLVVCPILLPEIEVVNSLPAPFIEDRGGGFGSTGTK